VFFIWAGAGFFYAGAGGRAEDRKGVAEDGPGQRGPRLGREATRVYFEKKQNIQKNCGGFWEGRFYARRKKMRFSFANAMAAFLVGLERGFYLCQGGRFSGD
jgi:hypothetical protein